MACPLGVVFPCKSLEGPGTPDRRPQYLTCLGCSSRRHNSVTEAFPAAIVRVPFGSYEV